MTDFKTDMKYQISSNKMQKIPLREHNVISVEMIATLSASDRTQGDR